jgi:hypothetical protein
MTERTLSPGQEPEPRPGPWPRRQDILYCENTGCLIRRRQRPAAITLMNTVSGALTLSCDECARGQYNHRPGAYRVLPLCAYRDWYAEARRQMQDGVIAVTAEVIDDGSARAVAPSPAPVVPQATAISAGGPGRSGTMSEPVSGRVITCQGTGYVACPDGSRAAVTIVTPSGACLACCDGCARYMYGNLPQYYRILPLSQWHDPYEDAKAAAGIPPALPVPVAAALEEQQAPPAAAQLAPAGHEIPMSDQSQQIYRPRHAGPGAAAARRGNRRAGAVLLGVGGGCLASWALGIFLVAWNNHLGDVNPGYNYAPGEAWGAFFILAPFIAGAVWVLVQVAEIAAAEHRRYREWKASLTPQQRMAVELSETAALTAAAVAWHKHNKQVDARLTSSVMGWTMPDGVTPRPSQRAALRHQQQPYVRQAQHAAQVPQAARMTEQLSHRWRPPGQG